MTPEQKQHFWMKVYSAAIRSFEVGAALGGQGTYIKSATEYARGVADNALRELNDRLKSGHFS